MQGDARKQGGLTAEGGAFVSDVGSARCWKFSAELRSLGVHTESLRYIRFCDGGALQCAVQSRPCRDHVPPSARLEIGRRPRFAPPPRAPAPTTNNSAAFSRPHKEQQESLRSSRAPVPSPRPRGRALTMPVGHERINDPNVHPVSVYSLEETPAPRSHRSEQRLRARALT